MATITISQNTSPINVWTQKYDSKRLDEPMEVDIGPINVWTAKYELKRLDEPMKVDIDFQPLKAIRPSTKIKFVLRNSNSTKHEIEKSISKKAKQCIALLLANCPISVDKPAQKKKKSKQKNLENYQPKDIENPVTQDRGMKYLKSLLLQCLD